MQKYFHNYLARNYFLGLKRSFDFKSRTCYKDYIAFLRVNLLVIFIIIFLACNYVPSPKLVIFSFLVADLLPMTSMASRRLNDTGSTIRQLIWILVPIYGWWKFRMKLERPSIYSLN